jgi:hypothetical protein
MEVKFGSRAVRDTFLFTIKAFFTKKQLKSSVIIHKIEETSFNESESLNMLLEMESLRADIARLYDSNEQKEREKAALAKEVARLQHEIEDVVTMYTKMAEEKFKGSPGINQSYASLTTKRDDVFSRKCQTLERENLGLNERLKLLTAEVEEIRQNSSKCNKNLTVLNGNLSRVSTIRVSPFSRVNATTFGNVLEECSEQKPRGDEELMMSKKLEHATEEKVQLEKKLEKSFKIIDGLEKQLKTQSSQQRAVAT